MKINGKEVVGSPLGWVDAKTGELVVSIRGLSKSTYKKDKPAAKAKEEVVEDPKPVAEEVKESLPAPKKKATRKKAAPSE